MDDPWHLELDWIATKFGCEAVVGVCAYDEDRMSLIASPKSIGDIPDGSVQVDTLDVRVQIAHQAIMIGASVGDETTELIVEVGALVCYVRLDGAFGLAVLVSANSSARKSLWRVIRESIARISSTSYAMEKTIAYLLEELVDEGMIERVEDPEQEGSATP